MTASGAEIYCKICTVDAVDEKARTVDVSPLDESAPIVGVNLQANQSGKVGLVAFPKKDSHVVVAFLNDAAAVVILSEQVDKVCGVIGDEPPVEVVAENGSLAITIDETTITADGKKHITFNGGSNGGLAITPELKTQLDKMTARIDGIIDAINNATFLANDGGSELKSSMVKALAKLTDKEDFSNIENADITH